MKFETKAWSSYDFVILDTEPLRAMELENHFEEQLPEDQKVFSFDCYDDTFDHLKTAQSNAVLYMAVNDLKSDYENIFNQLQTCSKKAGKECLLVPLYEPQSIFVGKSLASRIDNALKEVDKSKILHPQHFRFEMQDLWESFYQLKENHLVPKDLRMTYTHLAKNNEGHENIVFKRSTNNILALNLNLSWKDKIILDWIPVLSSVYHHQKSVLEANPEMLLLVEEFFSSKNLVLEIYEQSTALNELRKSGEVFQFLNNYRLPQGRRKRTLEKSIFAHRDKLIDLFAVNGNQEVKCA